MEQNKDQSGAITLERAGFKLASHVATPGGPIMASVTDVYEKDGVQLVHSYAMGGESWSFGAAVRGEAVEEPSGWKLVPVEATWEMTRPAFSFDIWRVRCDCGQEHSGGLSHNKAAQLFKSMAVAAPVSARAADAPSEPSEKRQLTDAEIFEWAEGYQFSYKGNPHKMTFSRGRFIEAVRTILSHSPAHRAADALDSQPTENPIEGSFGPGPLGTAHYALYCIANEQTLDAKRTAKAALACIDASSQPTDGGVRND